MDPLQGEQADIDFAHFVEIAKGATIRSTAAGDDYLEFGLAEQINIRVQTSEVDGVVVTLMSTLNKGTSHRYAYRSSKLMRLRPQPW